MSEREKNVGWVSPKGVTQRSDGLGHGDVGLCDEVAKLTYEGLGMAGKWPTRSIDELKAKSRAAIAIGPFGSRMKSDCYVPSGVPVIRGTNISDTRELIGEMVCITPEKAEEVQSSIIFADDLFFPHRGSIGLVGIVPQQGAARYVQSSSMMKLTCDRSQVEPLYLFYFFRSAQGRQELLKNASTVGTPGIGQPLSSLKAIRVPCPPLPVQKAIAQILGTLDDKIELNRRMNATLEAMARALFQSWFVDFDPVRAKLDSRPPTGLDPETAALFPATFQDSPLGHIPQGWEVKTIEELAERVAMGPFGSDIKVSTFVPEGIPVVSGQHLRGTLLDDSDFNFVTENHADRLKRSNVQRGDVIFTHAGSIGQVAYIPETSRYERYIVSQRQFYMRCDRSVMSPFYIASYFKTPEGQHRLLANTSSTGVPSISQPVTYLRQLKMIVPPPALLKVFDAAVSEIHLKMAHNYQQSRTIATLRDTLLPKLLNGELSVLSGIKELEATV
ncbi:MAG: restriction endonuclease subunit S [Sulfuricaulis sp.]